MLDTGSNRVPAVPVIPSNQGFGSELIREALPYRLGWKQIEFAGGGVRCRISLDLPIESKSDWLSGKKQKMSGDLTGKKILVVEDEYFVAADLKKELSGRGAVVIGPVGNLMGALSLIKSEQVDAAVLDVNLEGARSYPVMEELGGFPSPHASHRL